MKNEILSYKKRAIARIFHKIAKEGDEITFVMGTGKNKARFTRPILKIGQKTVTVQFDETYFCTTSDTPTGKKHIRLQAAKSVKKVKDGIEISFDALEHFRF